VLVLGDVVGATGRRAVAEHLPALRRRLKLDFVIVNGENAAHGFGITDRICADFYAAGADAITTGNHVWDQREIMNYIDSDPRLLRPMNYPPGTPGRGHNIYKTADGRRVMVLHPMGRLFMDPLDDPFAAVEGVLANHRLGVSVECVVVDVHAEATSEKMAMGQILDGRVSLVVGSHTHVPTSDTRILPKGTGYQTDLGMCGDYDSVIGMRTGPAIERFVKKVPTGRLDPAEGEATLCGVFMETDDRTGLARKLAPVRMGGCLAPLWPEGEG
jgi:metallophosphoesterase (TIGR00282 family)